MKILVGIMYCIENEFEQCKEAIRRQTHTDWELFTVENLPNKEAHDTLYQTFMDRADAFDLFIKIDADMVLCRDTFFEEVVAEMQKQPAYNHFQIGVWDHFTDRLIYALHVYRSDVRWQRNEERYFVDLVHNTTCIKTYMDMDGPLAPAADHCPNPSPFQAFHFGVHKAAKLLQIDKVEKSAIMARGHAQNITIIFEKYMDGNLGGNLAFAAIGCIWSLKNTISSHEVDFNSLTTKCAFARYNKLSLEELKSKALTFFKNLAVNPSAKYFDFFLVNHYLLGFSKSLSVKRSIMQYKLLRIGKIKNRLKMLFNRILLEGLRT